VVVRLVRHGLPAGALLWGVPLSAVSAEGALAWRRNGHAISVFANILQSYEKFVYPPIVCANNSASGCDFVQNGYDFAPN